MPACDTCARRMPARSCGTVGVGGGVKVLAQSNVLGSQRALSKTSFTSLWTLRRAFVTGAPTTQRSPSAQCARARRKRRARLRCCVRERVSQLIDTKHGRAVVRLEKAKPSRHTSVRSGQQAGQSACLCSCAIGVTRRQHSGRQTWSKLEVQRSARPSRSLPERAPPQARSIARTLAKLLKAKGAMATSREFAAEASESGGAGLKLRISWQTDVAASCKGTGTEPCLERLYGARVGRKPVGLWKTCKICCNLRVPLSGWWKARSSRSQRAYGSRCANPRRVADTVHESTDGSPLRDLSPTA